jgi:hypothetical protein
MAIFLETNEYMIIAAMLVIFLAATEIGFRSGCRYQSSEDEHTIFHIPLFFKGEKASFPFPGVNAPAVYGRLGTH